MPYLSKDASDADEPIWVPTKARLMKEVKDMVAGFLMARAAPKKNTPVILMNYQFKDVALRSMMVALFERLAETHLPNYKWHSIFSEGDEPGLLILGSDDEEVFEAIGKHASESFKPHASYGQSSS